MTTTNQGKVGAYTVHNDTVTLGDREIDARALLSSASRMQSALSVGAGDMAGYTAALQNNQRLWTIFQVAVCDPENPLPHDLKVTLLSLSRYIDKTTFRAVTEFMPKLVDQIIAINRTIAAGLLKKSENVAEQVMPANVVPPLPTMPSASLMTSA